MDADKPLPPWPEDPDSPGRMHLDHADVCRAFGVVADRTLARLPKTDADAEMARQVAMMRLRWGATWGEHEYQAWQRRTRLADQD